MEVGLLLAVLDPSGTPEAVLTTRAAAAFAALGSTIVHGDDVSRAFTALVDAGTVEHDPAATHREIRMTPRAQHDLLEPVEPAQAVAVVRAAADALMEIRPSTASPEEYWWAWRANARCLVARRPGALWRPAGHDLLFALGASLASDHAPDARAYWRRLLRDATEYLPPDHPQRAALRTAAAKAALRPH